MQDLFDQSSCTPQEQSKRVSVSRGIFEGKKCVTVSEVSSRSRSFGLSTSSSAVIETSGKASLSCVTLTDTLMRRVLPALSSLRRFLNKGSLALRILKALLEGSDTSTATNESGSFS